ncbi:MAG: stage II sporulation protein M [Candidatus Poribacteria bacterium]|nr:stage II sporulation protein M [Candidatus Poribacteria bacterium]
MTITEFISKKQETWNELETLLNRPRDANATQLNRLGYLYRRVTSDLAVARRDFPQDRCVPYLNELASRAHATVYQTSPFKRGNLRQFLRFGFPTLFRENLSFIGASFLMFAVAFAAAYWIGLTNPDFAEKLIPEHYVSHIKKLEDDAWNDTSAEWRNLFASFVMTNNIRVAFFAFAWGIIFMVGTAYILVFNGIHIGAIAGLCHANGVSLALWSFVSPHGYIELTTIFIAGGAGLKLGYSLIAPSLYTRKRALTDAAKIAVRLLGGCVALLIVAGTIEGFVSPSELSNAVKIGFGALTGILLFTYLFAMKAPDTDASTKPQAQSVATTTHSNP